MKKNKHIFYFLVALYSILFMFTFIMQWISIRNPNLRWIINGSTLLLGLIGGTLFYLLYQMNNKKSINIEKDRDKEDNKQDVLVTEDNIVENNVVEGSITDITKEPEEIPLKDVYIKFADVYILTKRETQIGYLVFSGYTNQQISEELYISETTVKKHLTHIYEKTQTSGRKEFKDKIKHYENDEESVFYNYKK